MGQASRAVQNPGAGPEQEPERIVVTATRFDQDPFVVPRSIDVVDLERMQRVQFRSLPQALRELPGTFVQETSPGQGSPYLRGFTAYNNLLLIDGVRLNNSTFRSGPNQYWATIDPLSVGRLEVLRGPASTLWGSDAVGGTVQVITKSPDRYGDGGSGVFYGGEVYGRYATAEDSIATRGEVHVGIVGEDGSRTGFLLGASARALGDIEGGRATGRQPNTSHDEGGFDLKVEHFFDADTKLTFLHQSFSQTAVPRTHSTVDGISWRGTSVGSNLRRNSNQDRRLTYLQLHKTKMEGAVQDMRFSVSWHQQRWLEDRIRSSGEQTRDNSLVGTLGAFAQFSSDTAVGRLTYGIDYYRDHVNSSRNRSTFRPGDEIQGKVADDATYDLLGVFVQDVLKITDELQLEAGLRYTYARADADSVRDPVSNQRTTLNSDWDELTGNVRALYRVSDEWNVFAGVSQGFRAPSLTDLTSFEIARSGEQEIPVTDLDEERFTSYEVGTKIRTDSASVQAAWFYTDIEDQILRFPTGTTTVAGDPIVSKGNVGDGYIQGVELGYTLRVVDRTEVYGSHSYQYGRISNFQDPAAPNQLRNDYPSRLMPLMHRVGLRWTNVEGSFYAETDVVRAEDADKLSFRDQGDSQRIPPGGTPSYTVWNARCGWQIDDRARLEVGVENLTDVDYRVHGSGSNSLGRNLVIGLRVRF
ncbi:MAG: TonB-dependent receptor [Planctomycetota bacterium]